MLLLLDVIKERLFADPNVRNRLIRDYGITTDPRTPGELSDAVIGQFGQTVSPHPMDLNPDSSEVFEAAVKAIASNSRTWVVFLTSEPRLRALLHGYDPSLTLDAFEQGALTRQTSCGVYPVRVLEQIRQPF